MKTKRRFVAMPCFRCGRNGHYADECFARTNKNGKSLRDEDDETCFRCGRHGHYADDVRRLYSSLLFLRTISNRVCNGLSSSIIKILESAQTMSHVFRQWGQYGTRTCNVQETRCIQKGCIARTIYHPLCKRHMRSELKAVGLVIFITRPPVCVWKYDPRCVAASAYMPCIRFKKVTSLLCTAASAFVM